MGFYFTLQLVFSTLTAVWLIRGGITSPEMALNPCESPKAVHSTVAPSSPLHGNVTMYCVVMFNDNATSDNAVGSWSRWPENKTWSMELDNDSFTTQHLSDNNYRMSLFLTNVTKSAKALYTFTVNFMNGKCSFLCPDMELKVEHECYNKEPEPIATDRNMTIIHTHLNALSLELVANYTGDTDPSHYGIAWWKGDFGDFEIQCSNKYLIEHNKHTLCSFTEKLIIYNLSMSDAGLYTAVVWGLHGLGHRTYFQVNIDQNPNDQNPNKKSLNGFVVLAIVVPIGIAVVASVCVSIFLYIQRKRSHSEVRSDDAEQELLGNTCRDNCGADEQQNGQDDSDDDVERDNGVGIWQTVPVGRLEANELARIAGTLTRWSDLVPYLKLSTAAIEEIKRDHKDDYKEQKFHMLWRWSNQQSTPNTRQSLVRIIDKEMKKPALAQEVTCIIQDCFTERVNE